LFGSCLTEYCDHIFNYALYLAKENDAKLWIYHGLGRLNLSEEKVAEAINGAEAKVEEAYVDKMKKQNFTNYAINVSDGDVVSEISKLARNAGIDVMVMGTSTAAPLAMGESVNTGPLGTTAAETVGPMSHHHRATVSYTGPGPRIIRNLNTGGEPCTPLFIRIRISKTRYKFTSS